jgi:hypothetical protein
LVPASKTEKCKRRGNVNDSDVATAKVPDLNGTDQLWVCKDGEVRQHKHCSDCSLLSVGQILINRMDYADRLHIDLQGAD